MKRKKLVVIVLALTVAMTMCFAGAESAFADDTTSTQSLALTDSTEGSIDLGTTYPAATTVYYQITPAKTGYIVFSANASATDINLCNSNYTAISGSYGYGDFLSYGSQYKYQTYVTYGVKAGKTYYVKVPYSSFTQEQDGHYYAKAYYTNSSVTGKFGTTKKKASTLKRSAKRYGFIEAGTTAGKWYKFTSSQKKVKVYLVGEGNDTLYAKVYYKAFGKTNSITTYTSRGSGNVYYAYVSATKKAKRTYYVKVYPKSSLSSGVYYLKWK